MIVAGRSVDRSVLSMLNVAAVLIADASKYSRAATSLCVFAATDEGD